MRQSQYGTWLHLRVIGTPQMVVDGKAEVLGSSQEQLHELLKAHGDDPATVRLIATRDNIDIDVGAVAGAHESSALLVTYLPEATTAVTRGENAGRSLHEFNIVRSTKTLGTWNGTTVHWSVGLKTLPSEATRAIALLQDMDTGRIVGAASLALR